MTVIVLVTGAGSPQIWTVPSDWDPVNNTVELIGAGGDGATGGVGGTTGGGAGGGGGGYCKASGVGLTPGATVQYQIGSHCTGASSASANETYFNGSSQSNSYCWAGAGTAGSTYTAGSGGSYAGGSGFYGGSGGGVILSPASSYPAGSGAGGGAAGYNGNGGAGGQASDTLSSGDWGGGGGGGADAQGAGGGANSTMAGATGAGGGGGAGGTGGNPGNAGTSGGGGGGGSWNGVASGAITGAGGTGGMEAIWSGYGPGGGGGGAGGTLNVTTGAVGGGGGFIGGGGGGGGKGGSAGGTGGAGGQGMIIITYTTSTYYTLTTTQSGGGGTTSGGGTFSYGTGVTAVATPNSGYVFTQWNDNLGGGAFLSSANPISFPLTANASIDAVFTAGTGNYTLTITKSPNVGGTVTGGGTFAPGTGVSARATPASGYVFTQWNDNLGGGAFLSSANPLSFPLTANASIQAVFTSLGGSGAAVGNGSSSVTGTALKPAVGASAGAGAATAGGTQVNSGAGAAAGSGAAVATGVGEGYSEPSADNLVGTWTNETGGTPLYPSIDEHLIPIDSNYIRSVNNPVNDVCKVQLSSPGAGTVTQPYDISYRIGKSGSAQVDITVDLMQGSTVIATWIHTNVAP